MKTRAYLIGFSLIAALIFACSSEKEPSNGDDLRQKAIERQSKYSAPPVLSNPSSWPSLASEPGENINARDVNVVPAASSSGGKAGYGGFGLGGTYATGGRGGTGGRIGMGGSGTCPLSAPTYGSYCSSSGPTYCVYTNTSCYCMSSMWNCFSSYGGAGGAGRPAGGGGSGATSGGSYGL